MCEAFSMEALFGAPRGVQVFVIFFFLQTRLETRDSAARRLHVLVLISYLDMEHGKAWDGEAWAHDCTVYPPAGSRRSIAHRRSPVLARGTAESLNQDPLPEAAPCTRRLEPQGFNDGAVQGLDDRGHRPTGLRTRLPRLQSPEVHVQSSSANAGRILDGRMSQHSFCAPESIDT